MSLADVSTTELSRRLRKVRFGEGDPIKVQQLIKACADRLDKLASPSAEPEEPQAIPEPATKTKASRGR